MEPFNSGRNYTDFCLTETDKANGVQSYDGFMKNIKRKTPLPKELEIKPLNAVFRSLAKNQIRNYIDKGVIKIDFKIIIPSDTTKEGSQTATITVTAIAV